VEMLEILSFLNDLARFTVDGTQVRQ